MTPERHTAEPAQPVSEREGYDAQGAPASGRPEGDSPRGVFVTFEGGDGVGKSTHIRYVANELRRAGREVVCLREPGGTGIGESLRAIVLDPDNGEISSEAELLMYEAARAQLTELVVEADDELMMKYLEGEEQLTQDELESLLDKAIAQELFIPVFVGSTIIKQGIQGLMEDICTYFPHPTAHGPIPTADGGEVKVSKEGEPACFVFKTLADPYVGRLSFVKVLSGTLVPGLELLNARTGKKERLGHLYVMMGKEATDVKSAKAGDIIVVPKLAETRTGDTISLTGEIAVDPLPLPVPQYPVAIEAVNKKEEDKLGTFLARAAENDPSIHIQRNEETHQTVLTAMGDTQVDMLISRCKEQTGVDVRLVPVRIPYRETIRKTAEAEGRHKKQTGGHGQFGDVIINFEPCDSEQVVFEEKVFGGSVPKNFFPAVEKGLREAAQKGVLAGYPVVGLKATLLDGSYHPVDSSEMAFIMAAKLAYKAAMPEAGPVILEPIHTLKAHVPNDNTGDIMGDVTKRRGRVLGMEPDEDGLQTIIAEVPLAELANFTTFIRQTTQGRGWFTTEFARYETLPEMLVPAVVEQAKKLGNLDEAADD